MAKFFYDGETDTLYVERGDGFGWLGLLFLLASPALIIAVWLEQYALFVSENILLSCSIFLALSILLGILVYRKKKVKRKLLGIAAVVVSLLPVAVAQIFYAIPYILAQEGLLGITFEWLVVTFFTVGISFFVIQISLLFRNGLKHLLLAGAYLIVTLIVIL